uniref:Uncharacterized protein n=1 Tax=Branchiostoma floridae TaxID=7739 RepID=C3YPS0_BRAFL|eukprot:XP_002601842.1 hypothetical protein BRAFLDRAFT_75941 [Branchiostoma floridae]
MAATEVVSWRPENRGVGLRSTKTSRVLTTFIVCTVMFTAVYILQAALWRNFTKKLHPDVHLVKGVKMENLALYKTVKCEENETSLSNVHCQTDYSTYIGHYNTCAVVGNSGVLLESRCGAEIDSKDYVIRIDIPPVRGYEKDVGERTSMTVLNLSTPKRFRSSASLKNRTQDVYESRLRNIGGTTLVTDKTSKRRIKSVGKKYHLYFSLYSTREWMRGEINP